jgi:hypothetical protein
VKKGTGSAKPGEDVCADIGGGGPLQNTFAGTAGLGYGDLQLDVRFAGTMRFPGFAGGNAPTSYFQARNAGSISVDDVNGGYVGTGAPGGGYAGGPACSQPLTP